MGGLVAHLHRLCLPWSQRFDDRDTATEEPGWGQLAQAATRRGSPWADTLAEHLGTVERLADRGR